MEIIKQEWFLAVDNLQSLSQGVEDYSAKVKGEKIYTLNSIIPLLFEDDKKCVGLVQVKSFSLEDSFTTVFFEMIQPYDKYYPIAQFYYNTYDTMNREAVI